MAFGGVRNQFKDHVVEVLAPLGPVAAKRFFGGIGITHGETLFAMIMGETLYFRVNDESRPRYVAAGAEPFSYETKTCTREIPGFYAVPDTLLDEPDELIDWAKTAIAVAAAKKAGKKKTKSKTPG
jgi:DNA transformation protein